ncbi:MAG: hypothetical protein V3U60_16015 [Gammaproteobacteria bacterium]
MTTTAELESRERFENGIVPDWTAEDEFALRERIKKPVESDPISKAIADYTRWTFENPIEWVRMVLGVELWDMQAEILLALRDHDKVAARSSNATGKSFLSAVVVPWYLSATMPGYAIITSASWASLSKTFWPTLHKVLARALCREIADAGELKQMEWFLGPMWGAFSVSTNSPENFGGFRTEHGVLVIVDEASSLDTKIMEAIDGLCAAQGSKIFLIGNPLRPSGPFYQAFKSRIWKRLHISAFDSPNVKTGQNIIPGLASRKWIEERKVEWGEGTPAYEARVLGNFPEQAEDSLISLYAAEEAVDRPGAVNDEALRWILGVDVARLGNDRSVIQPLRGLWADPPIVHRKQDTMRTVHDVVEAIDHYLPAIVRIDDVGLGGGVVDRLQEIQAERQNEAHWQYHSLRIVGENVGNVSNIPNKFINRRAEGWWSVRMWIEAGGRLPNVDLAAELASIRYWPTSNGKMQIEPKDRMKVRVGHSPDLGDALMLGTIPDRVADTERLVVVDAHDYAPAGSLPDMDFYNQ